MINIYLVFITIIIAYGVPSSNFLFFERVCSTVLLWGGFLDGVSLVQLNTEGVAVFVKHLIPVRLLVKSADRKCAEHTFVWGLT